MVATPPVGFCGVTIYGNYLPQVDSLPCVLEEKEILWLMAPLGCDIIQNGLQDGRYIGFYCKFKLQICFARVAKFDTIKHFTALLDCYIFFHRRR